MDESKIIRIIIYMWRSLLVSKIVIKIIVLSVLLMHALNLQFCQ